MKKFALLIAFAAWAGIAVEAQAQMAQTIKLRVNHSFAVAQSWLPAGDYEIRTLDTGSDQPVLMIRSEYGAVLVPANRVDTTGTVASKPEAVFAVENNKFYLRTIKMAGSSYGLQVLGSPAVDAD